MHLLAMTATLIGSYAAPCRTNASPPGRFLRTLIDSLARTKKNRSTRVERLQGCHEQAGASGVDLP